MHLKQFKIPEKEEKVLVLLSNNSSIVKNQIALPKEEYTLWNKEKMEEKGVFLFEGTMEDFLRQFTAAELEQCNHALSGCVLEWSEARQCWEGYRCQAAVLHCCAGAYLRIVNRKEIL